jgi:2-hydroxychromene-2-carboxylate isomerase
MSQSPCATAPAPVVEFWFEFGSNYSYPSVMRIEAAAAWHGVKVAWKPFMLGPIFHELGMDNSPFVLQKEKGAYMWQDIARECRKYGLPWTRPSSFPRLGVLPLRVAIQGADTPWMEAFCQQVMQLNFVHDQDINSPEPLAAILTGLGLPAAEARTRGIFGAPTFFVGDEMFWGNDRLDDALACAAALGAGG